MFFLMFKTIIDSNMFERSLYFEERFSVKLGHS